MISAYPTMNVKLNSLKPKIIHPTALTVALHLAYAIHAPDLHLLPLYIFKQNSRN
ncbi:hypothetical protein [Bacteroides ovatus]|uniref:hypothetical protein n=1 Tax=Bacteroides ovatus TaxID=28116 RepID=UPI001CDBC068|nr:hypothetical protein [Bacteroides ovatus]MCA4529049.1 hypothetical protein [Bacteroides ovatus]MCA4542690.1 hypothetical protein [Bacteroides ovatus]MCA4575182.1 hypothetical protein [Bacteroides ovatus]